MPVVKTKGAASAQGFGEFAKTGGPVYVEDVFSTYLYTGNSSTQTITNGIDLSGKGGLVWLKTRSGVGYQHFLTDSARGITKQICSNLDTTESTNTNVITSFNADGFSLGNYNSTNPSGLTFASWTFRKQPKFFDVVTYTGNGTNRTIAHNLGSVPGCVIVKSLSGFGYDWQVYHNGLTSAAYTIQLNKTNAQSSQPSVWNSTAPTSSVFSVGTDVSVNESGQTFVAYIFAHNAGGFGLTGTDNVISCGSFTTDANAYASVNLGYEPQWILYKPSSTTGDWRITDNMRGWSQTGYSRLFPNLSNAESSGNGFYITSTGFQTDTTNFALLDSQTYIYIAIRRGPMKVPTDGTKVFGTKLISAFAGSSGSSRPSNTTLGLSGVNADALLCLFRGGTDQHLIADKLRGYGASTSQSLATPSTAAETTTSIFWQGTAGGLEFQGGANTEAVQKFLRAPGFFDEVCYTGTGSATTVTHNLGAVPELMIVKSRSSGGAGYEWPVYASGLTSADYYLLLNTTAAQNSGTAQWNGTAPTSTVFSVGAGSRTNGSSVTYVAYLFATCPGVSKVGSYTGTGATQTIDCGFTGGARFVLIKRTDSTGDWYVWDTARGMVSGTDPSLLLNSTAAEVNANSVYTTSVGFQIVSTAASINASGGTYIFLAIA